MGVFAFMGRLFPGMFVEIVDHAQNKARRDPLEVVLSLQRTVYVLGPKQGIDGRLKNDVCSGVVADMVIRSWIGRCVVDSQVAITEG